ncbi:hypothetical protein A0E43_06855 [Pectobacterium cacticida]
MISDLPTCTLEEQRCAIAEQYYNVIIIYVIVLNETMFLFCENPVGNNAIHANEPIFLPLN